MPGARARAQSRGSSTVPRPIQAVSVGRGNGPQALALRADSVDRAPVAGKAKVRVIHLSPDAPAVDVVVLSGGAIAARPVTNLAFPNATITSLQLDPGSYTLAVVPTGASTPLLPTAAGVTVTLAAGDVVTVVAIGALSAPGAQPFQFKVLDDRWDICRLMSMAGAQPAGSCGAPPSLGGAPFFCAVCCGWAASRDGSCRRALGTPARCRQACAASSSRRPWLC